MLKARQLVHLENDGLFYVVELVNDDGTAWAHQYDTARRVVVIDSGNRRNNIPVVRELRA